MTNTFRIKVPGSTANLGPGFDSIGVGLQLYLTLDVTPQDKWEFNHIGPNTPPDTNVETHLIYKTALHIASLYHQELPPCKVFMQSELPLARGLGSSAAAIVASIELANKLCDLNLSTQQKLTLASQMEGHPDNATASILGGITISSMVDNEADTIVVQNADVGLVVIIPQYELKTSDARAVLPGEYSRPYAVTASANANMLVANLLTKNFDRAGFYMEQDLFHEPYRASLIPDFHVIKTCAKGLGAYGTALSGAGPTMISFVPHVHIGAFVEGMKKQFKEHTIIATKIDNDGVSVTEIVNSTL